MSDQKLRYVCEAYKWMGQSFQFCDDCGQPLWVHTHRQIWRWETKRLFNEYLPPSRRKKLHEAFEAGQTP